MHLEKILASGVTNLEPASYSHGKQDILQNQKTPQLHVWLTSEPYVPNTARPIYRPTGLAIRYMDPSEFDGFYRFIFDTSGTSYSARSVRQKKVKGSKTKAIMRSRAKAQGDDIKKWWVSSEPLEIGEYERAVISPNAKDSYIYKQSG